MACSSHRFGLLCTLSGLLLSGCAQLGSWSAPRLAGKPATDQLDRPFALARLTERKGNLDHAEQMYRSMQQKHGNDPALEHRLGVVAARQGRFEEARQHFAKAVAAGGETPEVMTDLGYCCYLMDDLPAAENALRSAVTRDPNNQRARNNLGLVLGGEGRYEESLAQFKLAGTEAEAHSNLAYVYSQAGDLKRSAEEYNLALTMNQKLRPAAEALVQIVREEPARDKARQMAVSRQRDSRPSERAVETAQGNTMVAQAMPARDPQAPPAPPQVTTLAQSSSSAATRETPASRTQQPTAVVPDPRIVTVSHARSAETDNRVTPVATSLTTPQQQPVPTQTVTIRSATTPTQNTAPATRNTTEVASNQSDSSAGNVTVSLSPVSTTEAAPVAITDYRMDGSENQGASYRRSWRSGSRR